MKMHRVWITLYCAVAVTMPCVVAAQGNHDVAPTTGSIQLPVQGHDDRDTDPSTQAARDKAFLKKAYDSGFAEIQLGQLATQIGGSVEVKQFGQKMAGDHTALNASIQPSADSMGVEAPAKLSKAAQQEYDKLTG